MPRWTVELEGAERAIVLRALLDFKDKLEVKAEALAGLPQTGPLRERYENHGVLAQRAYDAFLAAKMEPAATGQTHGVQATLPGPYAP